MSCTVDEFVSICNEHRGIKEGTAAHKAIIDLYNTIKPLPRGYKATYKDSWCAIFVSAMAQYIGATDIIYPECSADKMKKKYAKCNQLVPLLQIAPGDIVFYDWDHNGSEDHVGVCVSQLNKGRYIRVVEGNKNNMVGERQVDIKRCYINAVARPKYKAARALERGNGNEEKDVEYEELNKVAREVIRGKWGVGNERKVRLASAGYNYSDVQRMVNKILKGDD